MVKYECIVIDENTVIVEKKEKPLIDLLENTYGFQVIPLIFLMLICLEAVFIVKH